VVALLGTNSSGRLGHDQLYAAYPDAANIRTAWAVE